MGCTSGSEQLVDGAELLAALVDVSFEATLTIAIICATLRTTKHLQTFSGIAAKQLAS